MRSQTDDEKKSATVTATPLKEIAHSNGLSHGDLGVRCAVTDNWPPRKRNSSKPRSLTGGEGGHELPLGRFVVHHRYHASNTTGTTSTVSTTKKTPPPPMLPNRRKTKRRCHYLYDTVATAPLNGIPLSNGSSCGDFRARCTVTSYWPQQTAKSKILRKRFCPTEEKERETFPLFPVSCYCRHQSTPPRSQHHRHHKHRRHHPKHLAPSKSFRLT